MFCPNCGAKLVAEGMRFCMNCGADLSGFMAMPAGGTSHQPARQPDQPPAREPVQLPPRPTAQAPAAFGATVDPGEDLLDIQVTRIRKGKYTLARKVGEIAGCSSDEAMRIVEHLPAVILAGVPRSKAKLLRAQLIVAGGSVELLPSSEDTAAPAFVPVADSLPDDGNRYDVELTAVRGRKIDVIAAVRSVSGCGLVEAKEFVEGAPSLVLRCVSTEEARRAEERLEAAGAVVTVYRA